MRIMRVHDVGRGRRTTAAAWAAGVLVLAAAPGWAGAAGIVWQPPVEIARGGGERGPWQQSQSNFRFVDDPAVAYNTRGDLAVAWVEQQRRAVLLQRRPREGAPGEPVDVSRMPGTFSWLPKLAWAPDDPDRLHVLWQEIVFSGGSHGGEIFHAVSTDGGRSFGPPRNLSRSVPGDGKGRLDAETWHNGSFDIALSEGGGVVAAWTEYDGRLWTVHSADAGRAFSEPRLVAGEPPGRPARAPALATRGRDTVVLAWTTGEDATADIRLARSTDGGRRFDTPTSADVTPGHSDAPQLAFAPDGTLHLVHHESAGGWRGVSSVRHLRSEDGGRRFGPATTVSAPLPPGRAAAGYPTLAIDARGRVVVAWELLLSPGTMSALGLGLGLAVAEDGRRFGPPEPVPGSADPGGAPNGSTQGRLMRKLALRGDGVLALANSALQPGSYSRVWLLTGTLPTPGGR